MNSMGIIFFVFILKITAIWCQVNDIISCIERNGYCERNGWDFIDNTFYFQSNHFISDSITIECDKKQNISIISSLDYVEFNLKFQNSTVSINFDSIDKKFITTITQLTSIIADKTIPDIHVLYTNNSFLSKYNFFNTKSMIKSQLKGDCDSDEYKCYVWFCCDCGGEIDNCDECSDDDTCTKCNSGYYLYNKKCYSCSNIPYCTTCSTTSYKCTKCNTNYYPSGSSCLSCTSKHCATCSSTTGDCTVCESGYYLSGTACYSCSNIAYCTTCSTTSYACIQCNTDYYPSGSSCLSCTSQHCATCSSTTGDCTVCESGYYLSGTACISCESNKHCVADSNYCDTTNGDCTQCLDGYTLNGITCYLCSTIDSHCSTCSQTSYKCNSCSDPYILSSDGLSCSLCEDYLYKYNETICEYCYNSIDNCQLCSNGTTCTTCYSPYVVSYGECVLCESNQYYLNAKCIKNTNTCNEQIDSTTCVSCTSNSYIYEYQCSSQNDCTTTSSYGCDECSNELEITTNGTCLNCSTIDSNCKYCVIGNENTCLECNDDYYLTSECECESISTTSNCEFEYNSKCRKCKNGYYLNKLNECIKCDDSCNICSYSNEKCLKCDGSTILTTSTGCIVDSNCISIENNECIKCNDGYYINNGECTKCTDDCNACNSNGCIVCSNNYLVDYNGICQLQNTFNCLLIENGSCISCDDGYDLGETETNPYCYKFEDEFGGCLYGSIYYKKCIECSNEYIEFNGTCYNLTNNEMKTISLITTDSIDDNCKYQTSKGCIKCNDGYYLENGLCYECSNGCETCYNSTMCLSCNSTSYINSNYECSSIGELSEICSMLLPTNDGCAVCNTGYYKVDTDCNECDESCGTCTDSISCLTCNDDYYQIVGESGLCTSYSELTNCLNKTTTGCIECNSSYYLSNYQCYSCNSTCLTCSSLNTCTSCIEEYVLIDNECVHYTTIEHCSSASNSKCSSCSGLNKATNGVTCELNILVLSLLIIIPILIIVIIIITIVIMLLLIWQRKRIENKERKHVTIFKMWRSNVIMGRLTGELCSNLKTIEYEGEIGVNEETRELICVGNLSQHQLKIQISTKDGCDKYEIRTNPQIITINKGEACEFEIFIKPLCTCKINDQIVIIALDIHKGEELISEIGIKAITIMTTRLDYDELIEDKKLGEGSFGIVYKGTFRGNQVAIKKMKQAQDNKDAIEEFNKEVSMLDKFRNDYIVHFYGAVFIPTKICMVTEFAQHGSLQDLMNNHKETAPRYFIKMKIIIDCSKGISYLHSNGILHRDIKPDNFLILSLDTNVQVNAKLTDFGSSRNINLLMTNMTFTKGIGTPKYMAPEILDRKKYKKPADIYSFAITMYETMIWDNAYPKTKFEFPWSIADFISNGERLSKPNTMDDGIYSFITNCWKQESKERYTIEDIVKKLEEMD